MNAKDVLIAAIEQAAWVTSTLLHDLSDGDLLLRPAPGMNAIAWQLGHLVLSVHEKLCALEPPQPRPIPPLPPGFARAHSSAAAAHASDSVDGLLPKADYLSLLGTMRAAAITAIRATPDAELDQPAPESLRRYTPTVGAVYMLIGTHEFMHQGQIVALRRSLGKPIAI